MGKYDFRVKKIEPDSLFASHCRHFPEVQGQNKRDFRNQRKILGLECTKPNRFYYDFCDFPILSLLEALNRSKGPLNHLKIENRKNRDKIDLV